MELVYLKDRMWCIYIHHRVWICYPNVVRRYGRGMSATCPLRAEMSHMWPCQEMRKHMVLPLTKDNRRSDDAALGGRRYIYGSRRASSHNCLAAVTRVWGGSDGKDESWSDGIALRG